MKNVEEQSRIKSNKQKAESIDFLNMK